MASTEGPYRDRPIVEVGPADSLERAVVEAPFGAVLRLAAGEYRLGGELRPRKSVTLLGAGVDQTRVVSEAPGAVLSFKMRGRLVARGIRFEHRGSQAANVVWMRRGAFLFEDCAFAGAVWVYSPTGNAQLMRGTGLRVEGTAMGTARRCVLEDNHVGVLVKSDVMLESIRVQRSLVHGVVVDEKFTRTGPAAFDFVKRGGRVVMRDSVIEGSGSSAVVVSEGEALLEGCAIRDSNCAILVGQKAKCTARRCRASHSREADYYYVRNGQVVLEQCYGRVKLYEPF